MFQLIMNKVFYLNNTKSQEKTKNFKNISDEKINFTFKCSSQQEKIQKTFQI